MTMTPQRWEATTAYLRDVFGREDELLANLTREARSAGLPDIAVSADVGRLLQILARLTQATTILEVGTLGGYSGIWLARGLADGGRLITIECEPAHARFAERQFERAGLAEKVDLRLGEAHEVLEQLRRERSEQSVQMVFLDADKEAYPDYWQIIRPMIAPGGLIVIDNALGSGSWWIDQAGHPARDAVDAVNRTIASDDSFESVAVPLRQGVMIGLRVR